jgi:hypothetical protein
MVFNIYKRQKCLNKSQNPYHSWRSKRSFTIKQKFTIQGSIGFFIEKCYTSQIFSPKFGTQMMCHNSMWSIILKNVSQSHKVVTHHLWTKFWKKNLGTLGLVWQKWFFFLSENYFREQKHKTILCFFFRWKNVWQTISKNKKQWLRCLFKTVFTYEENKKLFGVSTYFLFCFFFWHLLSDF